MRFVYDFLQVQSIAVKGQTEHMAQLLQEQSRQIEAQQVPAASLLALPIEQCCDHPEQSIYKHISLSSYAGYSAQGTAASTSSQLKHHATGT